MCCSAGGDVWHGDRDSRNLLFLIACHLTVCVSLQALLISVLYHLSDLLDERLPLALKDELTLHHDLGDLLWVVSIKVKPESHHLAVVGLQLTLCHSVSSVRNVENIELGLGELLVARSTSHGTPLVSLGGATFVATSSSSSPSSLVAVAQARSLRVPALYR